MGLDERGIIAVVQIATYGPLLPLTIYLVRTQPERRMGWVFLTLMSILRLIGAISCILSEYDRTSGTKRSINIIMQNAGFGPLLASTLGFLRTVSQPYLQKTFVFSKAIILLAMAGVSGIILAIVGGAKAGSAHSADQYHFDTTLRRAGMALFIVLLAGTLLTTAYAWLNWRRILRYRRRLLIAITIAMPFLCVRQMYSILAIYSPTPVMFQDGHQVVKPPSNSGLGKFSPLSSRWGIYLVMSVLMEYFVVVIFLATAPLPLARDEPVQEDKYSHRKSREELSKEKV